MQDTENERKNLNFVQWDKRVMKQYRILLKKSALAAQILSLFTEYMDKNNAIVISYLTLEELIGYSRPTLSKAIKVLKEDNWIQVLKSGNANVYIVNSAAFWQTWANKKEYSKFHATVIISESEQKKFYEEIKKTKLNKLPHITLKKDELSHRI